MTVIMIEIVLMRQLRYNLGTIFTMVCFSKLKIVHIFLKERKIMDIFHFWHAWWYCSRLTLVGRLAMGVLKSKNLFRNCWSEGPKTMGVQPLSRYCRQFYNPDFWAPLQLIKYLGANPFPDPVGHFGAPWWPLLDFQM